ncbi:MAG: hypothetical protein ACLSEA_05360 [Thomasclavelia ramosa]
MFDKEELTPSGMLTCRYDTAFIWKLLIFLAVACYAIEAIRFSKKDLPL